ncbi:MAG: HAMP domain-containing protein [Ramlibacter sp.]
MFDQAVGRVLLLGALVGLILGVLAAWWLLRRILLPLQRLTEASRAIAAGDLSAPRDRYRCTRLHRADPGLRPRAHGRATGRCPR